MTGCQCTYPGDCERYGRKVHSHHWKLCQTRPDYFELFSRKYGVHNEASMQSAAQDSAPCVHRGTLVALASTPFGQAGVFECRHKQHGETTIDQCRGCPDRNPDGAAIVDIDIPQREPNRFESFLPVVGKGPRIKSWAVGIQTAPRKQPTLRRCIDSMVRAGWESPRIFAEPGTEIPYEHDHLPITQRDEVAGCWVNWYLGLVELLQRHPTADAYIVVQDDIVFAEHDGKRTLREFLEESLWPSDDVGCVSIYCAQPYAQKQQDWYRFPKAWVWGALAFIFPRDSLIHFLAHYGMTWRTHGRVDKGSGERGLRWNDVVVGKWSVQFKKPVWYCSPSLVQHVGETSTVWGSGNKARGKRAARDFVGNMF